MASSEDGWKNSEMVMPFDKDTKATPGQPQHRPCVYKLELLLSVRSYGCPATHLLLLLRLLLWSCCCRCLVVPVWDRTYHQFDCLIRHTKVAAAQPERNTAQQQVTAGDSK